MGSTAARGRLLPFDPFADAYAAASSTASFRKGLIALPKTLPAGLTRSLESE